MSRLGSGSRDKFRDALDELTTNEDQDSLDWLLPLRLSDLAHADFTRVTRKWQVRPPVLAGLTGQPTAAILCGGRSARLISSLQRAAEETGSALAIETQGDCPSRIVLNADTEHFLRIETAIGIPFLSEYSMRLLSNVPPIQQKLNTVAPEKGVTNWQANIFDLERLRWSPLLERLTDPDALPKKTAIELKSKYETKYCVTDSEGNLRKLPKREAIYAAASFQCRPLIEYDSHEQLLCTPWAAPMPEVYTRIACLCSGELPGAAGGKFTYRKVPPLIATTLSALAGQPLPVSPLSNHGSH
jgi:hypothetical protein